MGQLRQVIGPICHAAILAHHLNVMRYGDLVQSKISEAERQLNKVDERIIDLRNFNAVFFTNWNFMIQTIYFTLALIHDLLIIAGSTWKCSIEELKGFLFTSFVFPCSIYVSTMFWSLYSVNREWVLPSVWDDYFPSWLNHSIHTNILVFLVIEVIIANQLLPRFETALTALTLLTVAYNGVFFWTYFSGGRWIYGLFYILEWPQRIFLLLFAWMVSVFMMKVGIVIENFKYTLRKK